MQGAIPTQSHNLSREVGHTTGVYVPYSFRAVACVLLRSTWTDQCRKVLWDRTYGFSSSSEKTRKSNQFADVITKAALSSHLFKDPECWSGRGLNPRPSAPRTGALSTDWAYQAAVNQSRLKQHSIKKLRWQFPDVTGMYGGIMLVPPERHKMKWKTDKTIDHQRHFVHFLWTSNRGQQVYDMRIVQLDFEEKTQFLKKKTWVLKKKNPEFWKKTWVLKTSEFF